MLAPDVVLSKLTFNKPVVVSPRQFGAIEIGLNLLKMAFMGSSVEDAGVYDHKIQAICASPTPETNQFGSLESMLRDLRDGSFYLLLLCFGVLEAIF